MRPVPCFLGSAEAFPPRTDEAGRAETRVAQAPLITGARTFPVEFGDDDDQPEAEDEDPFVQSDPWNTAITVKSVKGKSGKSKITKKEKHRVEIVETQEECETPDFVTAFSSGPLGISIAPTPTVTGSTSSSSSSAPITSNSSGFTHNSSNKTNSTAEEAEVIVSVELLSEPIRTTEVIEGNGDFLLHEMAIAQTFTSDGGIGGVGIGGIDNTILRNDVGCVWGQNVGSGGNHDWSTRIAEIIGHGHRGQHEDEHRWQMA